MARALNGTDGTCPTCKRGPFERHKTIGKRPSLATMERWLDTGVAKATDGCGGIETDGKCEHGHSSWLRALGLI